MSKKYNLTCLPLSITGTLLIVSNGSTVTCMCSLGGLNLCLMRPARLEGLPFPSAHFDFVRIVNIGLGVPEDEVSPARVGGLYIYLNEILVAICFGGSTNPAIRNHAC